MRALSATLLVAVIFASGCLSASVKVEPDAQAQPQPPVPDWPAPHAAAVRPGVALVAAEVHCTSNFLFASEDYVSLYLGVAAHCVHKIGIGERVQIADGAASGTLAYSSWRAMGRTEAGCAPEIPRTECMSNDFALVHIDDEDRPRVHPAMLGFGGPTQMRDSRLLQAGETMHTVGATPLRPDNNLAGTANGLLTERLDAWSSIVQFLPARVPGDSGSGVVDGEGRAVGIVNTLRQLPPGANGVIHLDVALSAASERGGLDLQLVTWPEFALLGGP